MIFKWGYDRIGIDLPQSGCALDITIIVVENGHGDPISNAEREYIR